MVCLFKANWNNIPRNLILLRLKRVMSYDNEIVQFLGKKQPVTCIEDQGVYPPLNSLQVLSLLSFGDARLV